MITMPKNMGCWSLGFSKNTRPVPMAKVTRRNTARDW